MHETTPQPAAGPARAAGAATAHTDSDAGPFAVRTAFGRLVNTRHPDPATIDIHNIARGLARIERFCGHCPLRPTVAQHSLAVCLIAEELNHRDDHAYGWALSCSALLHDAQEAYGISDVGGPTKRAMRDSAQCEGRASDYDVIEDGLKGAIALRFNLDTSAATTAIVHEADVLAYEYESGWGGWGTACAPEWVSALLFNARTYGRTGDDGGERAFLTRAAALGLAS